MHTHTSVAIWAQAIWLRLVTCDAIPLEGVISGLWMDAPARKRGRDEKDPSAVDIHARATEDPMRPPWDPCEEECKASNLSWPSPASGEPRISKLGRFLWPSSCGFLLFPKILCTIF